MGLSSDAPWTAFYGSAPVSLDYPAKTMYGMVRQSAIKHPDHTACIFMGRKTSYRALLQRIDTAAQGLLSIGIQKGDCVTICMPNCPQALECFYALNRIGAVSNMVHPLSAEKEIAFYLNVSRSKAILTLDQFYCKVSSILGDLQNPTQLLVAKIADALPFPLNLAYPHTREGRQKLPKSGYLHWRQVLAHAGTAPRLPDDTGKPEDCAAILYSGGTTGTPKGIRLSNRNFNALALQTIAASGYASITGMKMLSVMPIFHGFGLGIGIHTVLSGGGTCILVPRFNTKSYAAILMKQRPALIPGVPALFEALLRSDALKNADLSFLRGIFCGGDSLSPELKRKVDAFLKAHGCSEQIREGYGTTECVTASCLTPKDHARAGSIGIPFPDMFYKIVAVGTTTEAAANTEGEICISGPTVMSGYLDDPVETTHALRHHDDGRIWLHTGDLGYMDADGFVYFRQRIKRVLVTSGYNVYPAQLENILDSHEKVLLSCVIGIPDEQRGQRIKAYIVPMPGVESNDALKEDLLRYCKARIAKYALPREIEFRAALPKTAVGKVAYRVLEEEAGSL
ncbi:MAG: acyl--CoA ligase [Oscillospiraceae bacterium]|nr:acyl--CoA ligase [Oscillospiraceae bacterium]